MCFRGRNMIWPENTSPGLNWDKTAVITSDVLASPLPVSSCADDVGMPANSYPPPPSPALSFDQKKAAFITVRTLLSAVMFRTCSRFFEPGETLEECVHREVMEETGLRIRNLKYFGSQPWPYPSGIMVGYTAEYESGSIKLQDEELSAGAFYTRDNLPEIPKKLSIAQVD